MITKESTALSGAPSIGIHVAKTNVQSSRSLRTVEEILGAHPMYDDDFQRNTNLTDVSIDTTNSEEMMMGSNITEFHIHKHKELVTTELLNKVSNVPEVTRKHNAGRGHHNQSDPQSTTSADCKLPTRKDELFSSNAVRNGDVAEVMGKTLDIVEGFISDMLPKSSYLQALTIVGDNNETTDGNKIGDLKPTAVDKNNNNIVERANTILEPNNILGAHVLEKKRKMVLLMG